MKRSLFTKILDFVFPSKCALCGEVSGTSDALCKECLEKYAFERKKKCPVCGKTAPTCTCDMPSGVNTLICSTFYTHYLQNSGRATEKMIFALKRRKRSRLAEFFGREAAAGVMRYIKANGISAEECVITYPPRSEKNMADYGFDHAELVAEHISRYTGIPLVRVLERVGGSEQKTLDASDRLANARASLKLSESVEIFEKNVFLFDDVMTTGATIVTSTELLKSAGAGKVITVTVAKTEPKKR